MRDQHAPLDEAQTTLREVRVTHDPAVTRLLAAATSLSDGVRRLTGERTWS